MPDKSDKKKGLIASHKFLSEKYKQQTEALKESNACFQLSFEIANIAICLVNLEGRFTMVNNQMCKMYGYSKEELEAMNIKDITHPDDLGVSRKFIQQAKSGSVDHQRFVKRYIHKDGHIIWGEVSSTIVRNDQGNPLFFISYVQDITERKKAQENIARQAKLLDLIFQNSLDSIVLLDKDYNFIWVSETYAKSCQRDPSEFVGHNHFEFYPSKLKEEFDAAKKGKSIYRKYARPFIFPDHPEWGTTYWDLGLVPIFDDDGEIEKFLFTLKDVTEREKAEEKLIQAEQRYRTVAEFTYDWEWWRGPDGKYIYVSPSCERITGYKQGEFISKTHLIDEIILPEDRNEWDEHNKNAQSEHKPREIQFRIKRKDGEIRWIEHACQPVKDQKGAFLGFRASNRDITLRKEAEEVIQKSQDNLHFLAGKLITAQEEERRRLAREMHDDLTQRLALLAIQAGKLEMESQEQNKPVSAKVREMKEEIIKLSKDIHDISRQIHPAILDDLGLVDAIKSECTAFTQREGIHVEYEANNIPSSIPRNAKICIYRIIQESLRNIAKHAETDKAYVSLTCSDGSLFLTVRDNGIGFDADQIHGQKGIGITSMQERVRLIEGELSLQSKPGEGTVIKVIAPCVKEQE